MKKFFLVACMELMMFVSCGNINTNYLLLKHIIYMWNDTISFCV